VLSPGGAIRELNRRFQSKDDRYFTMVYGLLDTRSSMLRVAQAGHPGPLLIKKNGEMQILGSGGMPVGLWPEMDFDCFTAQLSAGDRLLLYSDGVTECMNAQSEAFGEERLLACISGQTASSIDAMLNKLLNEIRNWRGSAELGDDVSLLAIEVA
jgi:sigma-B regulation protein RsbU (phosphoserine phosphatase)